MQDVTWEGDGQREVGYAGGPRPAVIWIGVKDDDTGMFYPNDWEMMAGGFSARGTEASAEEAKRRALMVAQAIGDGFVPPGHTLFSLGTVVKVMCHCGDKIDLSDYENW